MNVQRVRHTIVKVCGIRTFDEGRQALEAGADWLGFVLWPRSKRAIGVEETGALVGALRAERDLPDFVAVGVFVDPSLEEVRCAVAAASLDVVQLSGHEPPNQARRIALDGSAPTLKALHVGPGHEAEVAAAVRDDPYGAARYLLDTRKDGWYGGTGDTFDWQALAAAGPECLAAGGLTPDNVRQALRILRPYGVDVSSGVELAGGGKDPRLVKQFVEAVRAHDAVS